MSGSINLLTRMRPATLPFIDAFTRSDGQLDDTSHPWTTPVASNGQRVEIVSNKATLTGGSQQANAFLDTGATVFDLTFDATLNSGNQLGITVLYDDPTRHPATPPALAYAIVANTAGSGDWTLYTVDSAGTFTPVVTRGAVVGGVSYTWRVLVTTTAIYIWQNGRLYYGEALRFTPTAAQTVIAFGPFGTTTFDNVTVTTPGVAFYDDFDRSGSTSLGTAKDGRAWTSLRGVWGTDGSNAYLTANLGDSIAVVDVGSSDYDVRTLVSTNFTDSGLWLRGQDVNNGYLLTGSGFYKKVSGAYTSLGNPFATTAWPAGSVARVTCVGSTFSFWLDSTSKGSITDSTWVTGTHVGLRSDSTLSKYAELTATGL